MEIYRALSDFTPPDTEGSQNILSFQKGDKFEIFDCHKQTDWWGARSLKTNTIGYVPCKYLQHDERKIGKLKIPTTEGEDLNDHKEKTLRRFADMQNQVNHRHPVIICEDYYPPYYPQPEVIPYEDYYNPPFTDEILNSPVMPETPVPDYDIESPSDKSLLFVKRFSNIIINVPDIDELRTEVPEPEPDYLDDSTDGAPKDSFPPPPPPLTEEGDSPQNGESLYPCFPRVRSRPSSFAEAEAEELMIRPKKLANPCVDSRERQALHRELLLNYKLGKNVLQKPELSKKLMDRRQTQKKKEWEDAMRTNNRTSFELKLEERATKLKENEESMKTIAESAENKPEYMRIHAKITHK